MEVLTKNIHKLSEIKKSEHDGEGGSRVYQYDVSNEPNSLLTPYLSDHLVEPIQINEPQVYLTSNGTCLMNHMEENIEVDQAKSFVLEDSIVNEALKTDFPTVITQTEESYTEGIYTSCITLEDTEGNTSDALEENCIGQFVLYDPKHNVLMNDFGEHEKSFTTEITLKANASNLDQIDPIPTQNTKLVPTPWTIVIHLSNFSPFLCLPKLLKHCILLPQVLKLIKHNFSSKQEPERKLQQGLNDDNKSDICVLGDIICLKPSYSSAVQNHIHQYEYLMMIKRAHLYGSQYDYSKTFDKLKRTLTAISMFISLYAYLQFSEFCAQAFDKLLRALATYNLRS
ncbi:uncharacterized protein LOC125492240 [Beta vulgaris subsp. vulgaris]|uniref:uncharacterized protein LOC125492240 n=1 Tax=Beta vulgaris subsp. vulgaris TaxID=3555 RepID=UPI002037251D|nr:uncharacterized protein LOC125492240 [Beta vulgaris subsp. vulgaris]